MDRTGKTPQAGPFVEEVQIGGHIIDSLILPKVLDLITAAGGSFQIKRIAIGQSRHDPSFALIAVEAATEELLGRIVAQIGDHGAVPTALQDCQLVAADMDGAFPEGFYSTTNQRTEVRFGGRWTEVADQEMDCGIVVEPTAANASPGNSPRGNSPPSISPRSNFPRCVAMTEIAKGMSVVIGHAGVRVFPAESETRKGGFEFMTSSVSTEKPKGVAIRQVAHELFRSRAAGGKTLLVGGPAIVHTGSGEHVRRLIRDGYINLLFAGNALATHDIEQSMFGTSLGVHLERGDLAEAGHEHHLRAINRIRRAGSIAKAVETGVLTSGIMYECVQRDVDFLLAGSIRDDGPLPDVITDMLAAQRAMREKLRGVTFALMVATTLHSIAVGNLLPDWVKVVCVDINPSTVIKLGDRGTYQTVGLVTDVEPFFRAVVQELDILEKAAVKS